MNYIVEFDIAAMFVEVLLVVIYFMRYNYPCRTNRIFMLMLTSSLVASAADVVSVYTLAHIDTVPIALNYVFNILYLLAFNYGAILFFAYVTTVTGSIEKYRIEHYVILIASVIDTVLLLTTPFTGWVINFDGGTYNHGTLFSVLYIISLSLLTVVFVLFFRHRKKLNRLQAFAILFFDVAIIVSVLVQAVWTELLFQGFVVALFLILIYISLQNPDDYMDKSTHCFNQAAFYETTERYIKSKTPFTLVSFTLDDFKYISRFMGIEAGNELVDSVSLYLRKTFGNGRVYHISECKFSVLLDAKTNMTSEYVVENIQKLFSTPYHYGNSETLFTPFICLLNYPEFEVNPEDINDAVENSFKQMSRNRDTTVLVATSDSLAAKRRESKILHIIKQAIRNDGFEVYYQPIYDTANKKFSSAEALIRLFDSELGFISPDEFIPMAEKNGMIIEIGEIVFRKVCQFLKDGQAYALGVKYIEVNLSTVQCMQENLAQILCDIMEEYRISPERINFEITETAHSVNESVLHKNMDTLIQKGSTFSMDDYGTGFSTANYLISLPMLIVKIDKSILWPAMKDEQAFIVLRHTVHMLKALHKKIVVEGVETEKMEELLVQMGCDYLQGYLYSKPIPAKDYIEFLKNHRASNGS
jgi:EAL domain-containing protein (putative c-di-GMP-specific phosphodiesterase class I)/GGDEF domain-containing protein